MEDMDSWPFITGGIYLPPATAAEIARQRSKESIEKFQRARTEDELKAAKAASERAKCPDFPESDAERLYRLRSTTLKKANLRPENEHEVLGQEDALDHVRSLLLGPIPSHMLFLGPPGVGKTTVARIAMKMARDSGRLSSDAPLRELDCAALSHDTRNHLSPLSSSAMEGFYGNINDQQRDHGLEGLPKLFFGAMAQAHLGILFLDEIGELPEDGLVRLLKTLEDSIERVSANSYDPSDERVEPSMRYFFEVGIPADFVLIGATTREARELPQALLSRCEIVRFKELSQSDRCAIAQQAGSKCAVSLPSQVAWRIASQSSSGREVTRLVQIAAARALASSRDTILDQDVPSSDRPPARAGFRA